MQTLQSGGNQFSLNSKKVFDLFSGTCFKNVAFFYLYTLSGINVGSRNLNFPFNVSAACVDVAVTDLDVRRESDLKDQPEKIQLRDI